MTKSKRDKKNEKEAAAASKVSRWKGNGKTPKQQLDSDGDSDDSEDPPPKGQKNNLFGRAKKAHASGEIGFLSFSSSSVDKSSMLPSRIMDSTSEKSK